MLTKDQEEWILHLDNEKEVKILPYNQKAKRIFEIIKQKIKWILGDVEIFHCGSTSLEILGQGEIDAYIPVQGKDFEIFLGKLTSNFGKPGSIYPQRRARFVEYTEGIKIEIFLINKETDDWKNMVVFEDYLKANTSALKEYKEIKEKSKGSTVQGYYRRKLEFINKILCHAKNLQER